MDGMFARLNALAVVSAPLLPQPQPQGAKAEIDSRHGMIDLLDVLKELTTCRGSPTN